MFASVSQTDRTTRTVVIENPKTWNIVSTSEYENRNVLGSSSQVGDVAGSGSPVEERDFWVGNRESVSRVCSLSGECRTGEQTAEG